MRYIRGRAERLVKVIMAKNTTCGTLGNRYTVILVRTVVELVKNKTYYTNLCSGFIGPFNEALRRVCNNYQFCELYELIALASVLQCEIQSVYPYIDYRAEMETMNSLFKPVDTNTPNNVKVVIFWTRSEDETLRTTGSDSDSIWNPNHFVPLIQTDRNNRTPSPEQAYGTFEV